MNTTRTRIATIRQEYHAQLLRDVIRIRRNRKSAKESPNFADSSSSSSSAIAWSILNQIGNTDDHGSLSDQTIGKRFEEKTRDFIERSFGLLQHLRPGKWTYIVGERRISISDFDQYEHFGGVGQVR